MASLSPHHEASQKTDIVRKLFRATYYTGVITLFLLVVVAGFTQTKAFRSYLRGLIIGNVQDAIEGQIFLGPLEGNLLTGFYADSVAILESGKPILSVGRLEVRYDPLSVFVKRASFSRITLLNPVFQFARSADGIWNLDRLIKPTPKDTVPSSWTVVIKQVEIKNGLVSVTDSSATTEGGRTPASLRVPNEFDFANLRLRSVNIDAGATIRTENTTLTVRSISFESFEPQFTLNRLSGEFHLASHEASVQKLEIRTPKSLIRASAKLGKANLAKLTSITQIQNSPIILSLRVERLHFDDVRQFVGRKADSFAGEIACNVEAQGTVSNLMIKQLRVQTETSTINATGSIIGLHTPDELELDIASLESELEPRDLLTLLPGLRLPDLSSMGVVRFNAWFRGQPAFFSAHFDGDSKEGGLTLDGTVDGRGGELTYDGTITTSRLNLAALLRNEQLAGSLNSTTTVKGSGTELKTLTGSMQTEIDSSDFYGLSIRPSTVTVAVANGSVKANIGVSANAMRLDLSSTITFQADDSVAYEVDGNVSSLDLADVLKKHLYRSSLTFGLHASGVGLNPEAMRGNLALEFSSSSFADEGFERGSLTAELNSVDRSQHSLHLTSDAVNIDVLGTFTPASLISTLGKGSGLLIETIRYRLASLDSLHSASGSKASLEAFQPSMTGEAIPMSISYAFKIKNAHPLGLFVGMNVAGSMSAKGRVSSDPEGIRFDADFDIKSLQWLDERTTFSMQASTLSFSFAGLDPSRVLQSLTADVHLAARAIELDSLLLNNVEVGVRQAGDSGRFSFASLIDSTVALELAGATKYDSGFMALDLEKCKVDFNSSYAIENIQPAPLRIGRDGLHIGSLWMRHEVEEIHASGTFAPNGASDLKFTVRDFLLTNIKSISNRIRESGAGVPFSGTVNAEVGFSGTFENPKLSLALSAHGVRYREIVLGQIVNRSSYADGALQLFAEFRSRPDDPSVAPDALVSGTIPFNISFTNAPPKALVGEMNLRVSANGFRLQLIEPFVSKVMTDLAGTIACDMKLTGLIESPSYEGSMTLRDVRLFFVPIGIQYIIDGTLSPRGRQIVLDNVSVSNIPQDRPDGKMTMSGAFTLDGIQIRDFDFKANGQLLVMKESSRRAGQNLYGDLFGATGPDGVTWRGTLARSFLSGTLLVKNADLVFPPMRQAQALPSNKIPVVLVDDRPAPQQDSLSVGGGPELLLVAAMDTAGLKAKSSVAVNNLQVNNPQPTRLAQANEGSAATFLDNIVHDLVVETQGITQIRFVFNNLTSEELFADIKGRAVFAKNGDQTRLTGEVELGNRSYYNSVFKKLDATGRINFTGNPFSPELDIVAKYEGTHRYDTTSASYAARTGAGATDPRYEADKVIVSLLITGTREQPKVKTELAYVVHGEIKQATGDVEADALAFLVTGSFRDELTQQQRGSFISTSMLGGLTSSILSGPLTDLLRKEFGIIRSIDVLYYGGNFGESADVRLTGEIGDAVIRLGGRVFNDINNTNVSLQIPMSAIMGSEKWRNLVLEAERRVEGVETVDQKRESKGLRLLYRITF